MEQRFEFVLEAKKAEWSFAELCRVYGISRPTGYELVRRYEQEGLVGLGATRLAGLMVTTSTSTPRKVTVPLWN